MVQKKTRLVIVGGTSYGTAAATKARRLSSEVEIILLEPAGIKIEAVLRLGCCRLRVEERAH